MLLGAVALLALAWAPAGALGADPSAGCTQTNAPADPDTEVSEWTCFSSPATVAGYEVKRSNPVIPVPNPDVTGHITRMEVDVADGSGPIPIDRLMLHHIVFMNINRPDAACGGPERFYGAGEERLKMSFPAGYGYPINPGDTWVATYMYMNHRPQTDKGWIKYEFTVDPAAGVRPVRSYWLDAGNCAFDPIYNVPGIDLPEIPNCSKLRKAAQRKGTKAAKRRAARCVRKAKGLQASIPDSATNVKTKDVTVKHDGYFVTGAGHVHGGAKALTMSKPGCPGNPVVAESYPTWGNPDHPFYRVRPILHEPGPIGMSAFKAPGYVVGQTPGIPVRSGQTIRLNSIYDDLQPHTRVMGIYIVYLAPRTGTDPPLADCEGLPAGTTIGPGTSLPGRTDPVPFKVPLTGLDSNYNAVEIDGPPGQFKTLANGATVTVGDRWFSEPNVKVRSGTTLNYVFSGGSSADPHNLTLANGPLGIGSPDAYGGATYSQRFDRTGTYRFFCGIHPVQMSQRVVVENPKKKKKKRKKRK